jgi:hypothetical protein
MVEAFSWLGNVNGEEVVSVTVVALQRCSDQHYMHMFHANMD